MRSLLDTCFLFLFGFSLTVSRQDECKDGAETCALQAGMGPEIKLPAGHCWLFCFIGEASRIIGITNNWFSSAFLSSQPLFSSAERSQCEESAGILNCSPTNFGSLQFLSVKGSSYI